MNASLAHVAYRGLQQGTQAAPNPSQLRVDVNLITLGLRAGLPHRLSAEAQLPLGRLATSSSSGSEATVGLGDLELRIRRKLPIGSVALGLAVPTGAYAPRAGAANLAPEASHLALGRGSLWPLLDLGGRVGGQVGVTAQAHARVAAIQTSDEYEWGPEVRGTLGGDVRLTALRLALGVECQWRGQSTEPNPFGGERLDSVNTGGTWWTVMPSASGRVGRLDWSVGLRVPVHANVKGNQLVPSWGGFVAAGWSWPAKARVAPAARVATASPRVGQITIVDYWASWCAPCATIEAALTEAAPRWTDVRIERVDMTETQDGLPAGAAGLPVVEIFDQAGQRAHLLVGTDALRVVEVVDAMRKAKP